MKKTLRSRIAAVAAVTVGMGVFASSPAIADPPPTYYTYAATSLTSDFVYTLADEAASTANTWDNDFDYNVTGTAITSGSPSADVPALGKLTFEGPDVTMWAIESGDTDGAGDGIATAEAAGTTATKRVFDLEITGDDDLTVQLQKDAPVGTYKATATLGTLSKTYTVVIKAIAGSTGTAITQVTPTPAAGVASQVEFNVTPGTFTSGYGSLLNVSGAGSSFNFTSSNFVEADAPYNNLKLSGSVTGIRVRTPSAGTVTLKLFAGIGTLEYAAEFYASYSLTIAGAGVDSTGDYSYTKLTPTESSPKDAGKYYAYYDDTAAAFSVKVDQLDSKGNAVYTLKAKAMTASLTGTAGTLSTEESGASVSYLTVAAKTANSTTFYVYPDGREGTAQLTVSVNGVVQGTYNFVFYGDVDSLTTVVAHAYVADNGNSTEDVIAVVAKDAAGNAVPGAAITAKSGSINIATITAANTTATSTSATTPFGAAWFAVTGKTRGAVTFSFAEAGGATATAKVNVTGETAKTVDWAFDKASYASGAKAVITFTLKDSDGNPVGDNASFPLFKPDTLKSTSAITLPTSGLIKVENGTAKIEVVMPSTAGTVTVTGTLSTSQLLDAALRGVDVSKSAEVAKSAEQIAAEAALAEAAKATAAAEAAKAQAAADAAKAAAAIEAVKAAAAADAAKAAAAIEAAKAEAAKATAAVAALAATVTSIQTAISTLVASTTATLASLTTKLNKIMKKFKIK